MEIDPEADEQMELMYTGQYLRRQAIAHFIKNRDDFKDIIREQIRYEYGTAEEGQEDSQIGPFSIKAYFLYMLKHTSYGDLTMIRLIASMWSVRITIVRCDSGVETKIRHRKALKDVDIALLFNCNMVSGHYSPMIKVSEGEYERLSVLTELVFSRSYKRDVDYQERKERGDKCWEGEGGDVTLSQKEVDLLGKKAKALDKIAGIVGKTTPGVPSSSTARTVHKERELIVEKEDNPKPQVVKKGDLHCENCNRDFDTTTLLARHVERYHKGVSSYTCTHCNRGFSTKKGLSEHKMIHKKEEERVQCTEEGCTVTFGNRSNMLKHVRNIHQSEKDKFKCTFCQKFKTNTKANLDQHHELCKSKNPERKEWECEVCGKKFTMHKKRLLHCREVHGWQ